MSNDEKAYEMIQSVLTGFPELRQSIVESALTEAEERGYQRGKAEDHLAIGLIMECRQEALDENKRLRGILNMPLSPEQVFVDVGNSKHGFMCSETSDDLMQTDTCLCGVEFTHYAAKVPYALNSHLREEWSKERPLSPEQKKCMAHEGLSAEQITSDFADLKLEGDALRDRLKARAFNYKMSALRLIHFSEELIQYEEDKVDIQILIDLIYDKERNCTMEADRLWDAYLQSLEPLCDTPEGSAKLYAQVGATYAAIVIDRAAKRRMREDSLHIPTIEELAMEVQQEVS